MAEESTDTSLLRAVGPSLQVNWFARAWSGTTGMRKFILNAFGAFLVLTALAVWAKMQSWNGVPWTIGGLFLIASIAVGMPFAIWATPPVWFAGFIRHQAGGEPNLSAEDGFRGGKDYTKGLWRFFQNCLFWAPLVFFGIGFFRVEDNVLGVIPFLGISLVLIIHYAGKEGTFFRNLVVVIYTGILLWFVAIWTPGLATWQKDAVTWVTHQFSLKDISDQTAGTARRNAETAMAQARASAEAAKEAAKKGRINACYAELEKKAKTPVVTKDKDGKEVVGLPAIPTQAEFDACAQIGAEATSATPTPPKSTAAGTQSPPAPAAPVKTAQAEPNWVCDQLFGEYDLLDGEIVDIRLPTGWYTIQTTGHVSQPFYSVAGQPADKHCDMDANGVNGECTLADGRRFRVDAVWVSPVTTGDNAPIKPGAPFGMLLGYWESNPYPLQLGSEARIHAKEDTVLNLRRNLRGNTGADYAKGRGLRTTITECHIV